MTRYFYFSPGCGWEEVDSDVYANVLHTLTTKAWLCEGWAVLCWMRPTK